VVQVVLEALVIPAVLATLASGEAAPVIPVALEVLVMLAVGEAVLVIPVDGDADLTVDIATVGDMAVMVGGVAIQDTALMDRATATMDTHPAASRRDTDGTPVLTITVAIRPRGARLLRLQNHAVRG
jgi:hypothetical protein